MLTLKSTWKSQREKPTPNKKPNDAKVFVGPNFHALVMQNDMLQKVGCDTFTLSCSPDLSKT